jgi:putative CocE/NonD family hydrolase
MRTPYGKDLALATKWLDPVQAAARGFMVIVQDTRGRHASDGDWVPFRFERQDGFDSVEWAAAQAGSNGRVGMFGLSYFGNTQWLAAIEQPPSLAAIAPALTWSEPADGLFARGGAVELGLAVSWSLQYSLDYLSRTNHGSYDLEHRVDEVLNEFDVLDTQGYWELPVFEMTTLRKHRIPDLGSISALDDPQVEQRARVSGTYDSVTVPTYHTGGWYDLFLQGTLDNYQAMAGLRGDARLAVGPWTHATFTDPIGEQLFGVRSARQGVPSANRQDAGELELQWLGEQLGPNPVARPDDPVRIFVMGRNEWRTETGWPPARAREERWYLHANGSLNREAPRDDVHPSEFVYDPAAPVPTLGGHVVMSPAHGAGPVDQSRLEARADVLVFTSEPLQHDLEVTGRVRVVLDAESSASSTDWVARVCDVYPDGRSMNICDGILRVTDDARRPTCYEIDLWSTSNIFCRGHRLRIDITSSSFPRWDRNLNTGNQRLARIEAANQRIHHSASRPSYVVLPSVR